MSVLSVKNLIYGYSKGTPFEKGALKGVSVDFEKGEIVALIGHTGSGKSTLLQHLNGLLKPDSGEILFEGESIHKSKETLRKCRFNVGLCFQYPEQQLFDSTVYKDVAFGPGNMGLSAEEIDKRVRSSVAYVGLSEDYLEKSPFDLSGGEKRRVAIAGVLSMEPKVLILDDSVSAVDTKTEKVILENLAKARNGKTTILIAHRITTIEKMDKIIFVDDGKILAVGSHEQLLECSPEYRTTVELQKLDEQKEV